jgi:chaperonin GroES
MGMIAHLSSATGIESRDRDRSFTDNPAFSTQKRSETPMKMTPLSDRVLVRRLEGAEEKRGGIIIPDTAKEKPQQGEIIAVGPGRMTDDGKRVTPEVKKGQQVLIGKYTGTEVKIDGEEYIILREDDILGIVG